MVPVWLAELLAPAFEPDAGVEPEPVLVLLELGAVAGPVVVGLPSGDGGAFVDDPVLDGPHEVGGVDAVELDVLPAETLPPAAPVLGALPDVEL